MTMLDLEMNALDIARSVAGLGVNWLIQSSLLIIAGLWIGSALRSNGSAAQSAVYRTTLAAVLVCPLVSLGLAQFGATGWSLEMPAAYTQEEVFSPLPQDADTEPAVELEPVVATDTEIPSFEALENTARLESSTTNEFPVNEPAVDLVPPAVTEEEVAAVAPAVPAPTTTVNTNWFGISAIVVGTTWLLLGGWLLARLAHSWRQLIRLRRTAMAADAATIDTCRNVAELFRVEPPAVLHSPFLPSPCLAGLHRPAVLLPDDELSLPMRDVLIHELAHLARGDCYWNLLRRIGTSLLFFQPLMWLLSRRLDSTAEEVCDDYVVQFGGDRREYAHRLVDIAELSVAPVAAAGVGIVSLRSMLAARVARIMDTSRSLSTRVGHALLALVLLAGLVGTILVGLVGVEPDRAAADANPDAESQSDKSDQPAELDTAAGSSSDDVATPTGAITGTIQSVDSDASLEPANEDDAQPLTKIHGRVVDEADQPVPGALIRVMRNTLSLKNEHELLDEQRAGDSGSFEVTMPGVDGVPQWMYRRDPPTTTYLTSIVATAPGYAAAWAGRTQQLQNPNDDEMTGELVLRLSKQPSTIRGQIVNLEGQPVSGASVQVTAIATSDPGAVDQWLTTVERLRVAGKLPKPSSMSDYAVFASAMVMDRNNIVPNQADDPYFPQKYQVGMGHPEFPAALTTGDDGRFEIAGLAQDQLVGLSISGPGIVAHSIIAVTREMDALDLPNTSVANNIANGYYGATFAHPAAPGIAIAVKLKDAESDEPLSGMGVSLVPVLNSVWTHNPAWHGVTDDNGTIRIEGLPTDTQILLSVDPPNGAPYLAVEHLEVPKGNPLETTEVEIKFRRGVFVRGKVTDAETGEPVEATLHYHPYLANENAKNYQRYQTNSLTVDIDNRRYRTEKDGTFAALVIPGRGILAAHAIDRGEFCMGLGSEAIAGLDERRSFPTHGYCSPNFYHRLTEIDVPADADEVHYDLTVSRGATVKYLVTDDQGQPLSGVLASGVTPWGLQDGETKDARVEVKALRPDEKRRVAFIHRDRRLGRIIEVTAPQNATSNVEPQTVSLSPCGTVVGKLIDGVGEPVEKASISAYALPLGDVSSISPQNAFTNDNGEFRLEYLPAGVAYRINGNGREFRFSTELVKELEFEPGETIELGTIDVTKKERPQPKRAMTRAFETDDSITVRGTVADPNGKPFGGATVQVLRWYSDPDAEPKPVASTTSDAAGRFVISFRKSQFNVDPRRADMWKACTVVASSPKFGPGFVSLEKHQPADEMVLRLVRDDVPVHGRLVDLEGNPLAGVTVRAGRLFAADDEDLTPWLDAVRRGELIWQAGETHLDNSTPHKPVDLPSELVTDADGRFRLNGVGRERRINLEFEGPTVARSSTVVVTRKMSPLAANSGPPGASWRPKETIYGADFELALMPTQPIVGTARDAATGQPLAGVEVHSYRMTEFGLSAGKLIRVKSDEEGRYRLVGMPKGSGRQIIAVPNDEQPYLMREFDVPDEPGLDSVECNLDLHRGVWITGRITDKQSGKPVGAPAEVWMHYLAFRDNPFAQALPEYDNNGNTDGYHDRYRVRADGTYRLVGLPGRAIVGLQCWQQGYPNGMGSELIAGIDKKTGHFNTFGNQVNPSRKWPTAMKEVTIAEDAAQVDLNFDLDAGRSLQFTMIDSAGNEVRGVSVRGSKGHGSGWQEFKTSRVEAIGLTPPLKRTVLFHHKERNIGKVMWADANDDSAKAISVTLESCATIRGRLIDDNEVPLTGAMIRITPRPGGDFEPELEEIATDGDGRFEHSSVLPGADYAIFAESSRFGFKVVAEKLAISPVETVDLGTIDVTKKDRPQPKRTMARAVATNDDDRTAPAQIRDSTQHTSATDAANENKITVRGRVVGPDGQPVASATVFADWVFVGGRWPRPLSEPSQSYEHSIVAQTASDAAGNFELTFSKNSPREGRLSHSWHIAAYANGYGPAWKRDVHLQKDSSPTLQLTRDLPVLGRILDLEGKPVAGVNVRIRELRPSNGEEAVANWIKESKVKAPPKAMDAYFLGSSNQYAGAFPTTWDDGGLALRSPALPADTKTDNDGRFSFKNLGENRLALLEVDSPSVAKSYLAVVTRDMESVSARPLNMIGIRADTYFGREFEFVAEPTQPIVGTVTDDDTDKPLENVEVRLGQFAGNLFSQGDFLATRTDAEGKYELIGAPQGGGHRIDFEPVVDQPYFPTPKTLSLAPGSFDPIVCDVALKRGQWIVGKVTDAASHEPVVDATVHYLPLRSNEQVPKYANYDPRITGSAPRDRYRTSKDGSFRVLAISGAGILAAIAHGDDSSTFSSLSVEEVPKHLVGDNGNVNAYHPWTITGYHALREVEILESVDDVPYSLEFKRGLTHQLKLVDTDGRPVQGSRVLGRVFPPQLEQPLEDSAVEVIGLRSNDKRVVAIVHPERRIGSALEIAAGDTTTISLEPCAIARGRVVDEDGQPISGVDVGVYIDGSDNWGRSLISTTTDADGQFEVLLPPGRLYRVAHYSQSGPNVSAECMATTGVVFELGNMVHGTKLTVEQTAKLTNKNESNKQSSTTTAGKVTATKIRGRVLDVEGQPVAGANLRLSDDEATEMQTTTSGLDGRFEIEFHKEQFTKPDWHREAWRFARLLVTADSFAPAWLEGKDLVSGNEIAVQLKRDDIPIGGQVLTLEGQPVPNARLVIWDVHQPNSGSLDGMFESLRESPFSMQLQTYRNTEMSWFRGRSLELKVTRGALTRTADGSIVTADAEGRFEFTGIGPERLARGRIEGENIQSVEVSIATRSKVDDWWKRESLGGDARMRLESGDRLPQIYPSTFEHFASPSSSITGVVLDRATGQPLAGIGVSGGIRGGGDHASGVTDENGRYELTGLAVDGTLRLFVGSNDAAQLPYIGVEREIEIAAGSSPKPEDTRFTLTRGIVVRGTVTDAKTGGPVKSRVEYFAHGSNPRVAQIGDRIYPYGGSLTNDRGEFAVVALPGRGALGATTNLAAGVSDHYRPVQAEDFGLPLTDEGWINTANHGTIMPIHYTAAVFLDLKPDEESRVVPLVVKPIFEVASVQCVDGQGQPLKKVSVIGQFPWNGKSRVVPGGGKEVGPDSAKYFQIADLEEDGRQPAIFMHRGTNSAAILFGSKSAQQPRLADLQKLENGLHQLTLKPVAIVTGKVVDGKGAAVDRASVELRLITDASPSDPTVEVVRHYTNAIGRFKMEFVPAGGPYLLKITHNDAAGGIAKRDIVLEPEQFLNLDRIDITKLASPESKQAAEKTATSDAAAMNLHGQVIGPNVEPEAGAHVAVIGASNRQRRGGDLDYRDEVLAETTTNADGTYQLSLAGISSKMHTRTVLVARADGAGISWQHLDPDARNIDASFELLPEEPIRGQLVDIEGQPAAGVRMSIAAVMPTSKDEKYTNGVGFRDFSASPAAWPKTITTDDNGRFVIHGIPASHGVFINVAGSDRFAPQQISLNSGMPEQRGERDGTYRALVKNLKPGEEAVLALAPAQIFEGVVRYEDTNQPAPHARLTIWASQQKFGSMISVPGKADAQGRYRISPNPGIRFGVTAYPPDGVPYLTRELPAVDWDDAAKLKQVDVTLPRGVLVRGKVLESSSGAPVAGATIQYVPEDVNNRNDADDILTGWQGIQLSNERGEFEIVVLPGPGNLLVHGPQGEFVLRETSDRQLSRGRPGGQRNYANSIERVDPADGAEPVDVTIRLQRGAKVTGQLVNEAGEPVDEAILISQLNIVPTTLSWRGDASKQVLGGSFELSPLEPNQKYTVYFLDAKRRLGATATLTTEDVAPTVILKPCGQATARFVDAAGQPLADFRSSLHMAVSPGASEYDFKAAERGELAADADFVSNIDRTNHWHLPASDKDGRITFPALIPGAIYRITRSELGDSKEFSVESGQTLDLGQIVIDREQ